MDPRTERAIIRALSQLPADQRRAATHALYRLKGSGPVLRSRALEIVGDMIRAQARTSGRRRSDARTDAERRILIGARVPREDADRFRQAASRSGQSLYAWVRGALEEHAQDPAGDPGFRPRRSGADPDQDPGDPARILTRIPEIRRGF